MSNRKLDDHTDDYLRVFARQYATNGSAPRLCAYLDGHVEHQGAWGPCCAYCGLALPERPGHVDGEGGEWWYCAVGRVWRPR